MSDCRYSPPADLEAPRWCDGCGADLDGDEMSNRVIHVFNCYTLDREETPAELLLEELRAIAAEPRFAALLAATFGGLCR